MRTKPPGVIAISRTQAHNHRTGRENCLVCGGKVTKLIARGRDEVGPCAHSSDTPLAALPSSAAPVPTLTLPLLLLPLLTVRLLLVEIFSDTIPHLLCNHSKLIWDCLSRPFENIDQPLGGSYVLGRVLEKHKRASGAIHSPARPPDPMDVLQGGIERIDNNMRDVWDVQPPTNDISRYQHAHAATTKFIQYRQAPLLRTAA